MPIHRARAMPVVAGRRQHRKLVWATDAGSNTIAAGARVNRDLLANLEVAGSSVLGATVMRTHVRVAVTDATSTATFGVQLGLIVSTAPTVTNIDAAVAFGDDWMLNTAVAPGTCNGQSLIVGTAVFYGERLDVKAKRKIEELGEKYFLCCTNNGSAQIAVGFFTRTLIALP